MRIEKKTSFGPLSKGYEMLNAEERRALLGLIAIIAIAGLGSAGMIAAIFPFLSVLSDPEQIEEVALLAWTYDTFGFETAYSFLIAMAVLSLAVVIVANGLQVLRVYAVSKFTANCSRRIGERLFNQYIRQDYTYFLTRNSNEVRTRILGESIQVVGQFYRPIADIVSALLGVFAIGAVVIWMDPIVALSAFALLGGCYIIIYLSIRQKLSRLGETRVIANQRRYRVVGEALDGIKNIKLYNAEQGVSQEYRKQAGLFAQALVRMQVFTETPVFLLQIIAFGGIILLCTLIVDPVTFSSGGDIAQILPTLGIFAIAGQRMMPELGRLFRGIGQLRFGVPVVDSLHSGLTDASPPLTGETATPQRIPLKYSIALEKLSFRYPETDTGGLSDVDLRVEVGETIGIAGSSGAGKTTLADTLLGLIRQNEGTFSIDGVPLSPADLPAWRQSVAYVPQEIFLLDTDVMGNIAYGVPREQIDFARVRKAAKRAELDNFIMQQLDKGYETQIGEKGIRLSGGQRQRMGIARALYRDADVIIMDEATSALDNMTERNVMDAIASLHRDKTLFIIAHRMSTLTGCDRILVLEKGRVTGLGTWDEMARNNKTFRVMLSMDAEDLV